jgi:hypothetical protein
MMRGKLIHIGLITFGIIALAALLFCLFFLGMGGSLPGPLNHIAVRDSFTDEIVRIADFEVSMEPSDKTIFRLDQPPSELAENIRAGSDGYHDYEVREYPNGTMLVTVREDGKVQTVATLLETTGHSLDPDYEGAEYRYRLLGSEIEIQDSPRSIVFPYGLVDHIGETLRLGCSYETGYSVAEFEAFYRYFIECYPEYLSDDDLTIEEDTLILGKRFIRPEDDITAIRCTITDSPDGDGYRLRLSVVE